ncbi:hypothetical protein RJ641_007332 [Dillenia turbinata]|uniref:Uncharacterized protein n=1 Tax=Dillenia turbinata TaxID=194707 RepID=A0AAN8UZ19_9MAGN
MDRFIPKRWAIYFGYAHYMLNPVPTSPSKEQHRNLLICGMLQLVLSELVTIDDEICPVTNVSWAPDERHLAVA